MSYQSGPSERGEFRSLEEMSSPEATVVKALPMLVPETTLQHDAEKKRVKRGILSDSEERRVFEKLLYLPYLDFTYQYPAQKGFLSKQPFIGQGRSVVLALREVDLGFYPDLAALAHQLVDTDAESDSIVQGIDSTVLVNERLEELKKVLSDYDNQLQELDKQYSSLLKTEHARQDIKDSIDHLKKTRDVRWKMFSDGLKLPSKIDLEKIELLEGSLFYMPYFMVKFARGGESRFFVWDREGKENEPIAEELMKNHKFRELIQSYAGEQGRSDDSEDLNETDPPVDPITELLRGKY
jgi:hypothetical protein